MEKKTKRDLLMIIEDQNKTLLKYKSRLHDVVESYKHLIKEKEALESSIKTLTEAGNLVPETKPCSDDDKDSDDKTSNEERNDACLQMLRTNLGALTIEKSRIENELRTDRKKLLQKREELENSLKEKENKWLAEQDKCNNQILELKKKISIQQREREKEQQDHALMLKELQNLLASERVAKERFEEQVNELQQKFNSKLPEKRALDYEKIIEDLQNKLKVSKDRWLVSENQCQKQAFLLQKLQQEMDEIKLQYLASIEEEKKRADLADEKLKLLSIVEEKRVANLENRISELSAMIGNYDKLRQQDQLTIQKLKEKLTQQVECTNLTKGSDESKLWDFVESDIGHAVQSKRLSLKNSDFKHKETEKELAVIEISHAHCQTEIIHLREELEQYKIKAESALKEKYNKTSAALLSDAKAGKEIKELKSRLTQLQDQLQASKAQLKLNEEYHNKITANLEKSLEELKMQNKQEVTQMEIANQTKLLELEHQIQKQRERTLSLLEEKDKEIGLLKSTFLSSFIKKETSEDSVNDATETSTSEQEAAAALLSNSLISSKKDGHMLHYIQELARKDVEISNLRHARIQTESALRKLQQISAMLEEKYTQEIEALKSRIMLLESSENKDGTNVEYLKNVVLRFLKCNDPSSRKHMINAIATVLHFTRNEVQEVKAHMKFLRY